MKNITIAEKREEAVRRLQSAGVFSPEKDAWVLISHALRIDSHDLQCLMTKQLGAEQVAAIDALIERREAREPLNRILGKMDFCGVSLHLHEDVFRPCPEIENIVTASIDVLQEKGKEAPRILDLGTGAGALMLGLLRAFPKATGVGIDISEASIKMAQKNAKEHDFEDRAVFYKNDWLDGIDDQFDLIVSNPPAIATDKIALYPPEMKDYNPSLSIDGGKDGLCYYKKTARALHKVLKDDGVLAFRAYSKKEAKIFYNAGFAVQFLTDFFDKPYMILVQKEKPALNFFTRLRRRLAL